MQNTVYSKILKTAPVKWRDIKVIQNAKFKELTPQSYDKLKQSILHNKFVMPFFVWEDLGELYLLDGKHRIDMLNDLVRDGFDVPDLLPATFIDCFDRAEASKFVLLFSSSYAHITKDGLSEFISLEGLDIEQVSMEIDIPYLDFGELTIGEITPDVDYEKQDEVPEVPEETIIEPNDLFILDDRHIVYCQDSLNPDNVRGVLKLSTVTPELTFTDPPYELKTKGGGVLKKANSMKQISDNKVDHFEPEKLELYSETNIYFHNKPLIKKYIDFAESRKQAWDLAFYKKEHTAPNYGGHMMTDVEYIIIIGKQGPNKGLPKETYSKSFTGKKDKDNELSYSKPVLLCEKYVQLYSKGAVLDQFLGSGSTLIACENLGRRCYGLEKDPKMVEVILRRYLKCFPQASIKSVTRPDFDIERLKG